jgi:SPP1 family predicted phage head-tail adaptor
VRAGQLRHRVTIQEPDPTQDEYGEAVPTWSDMATVWAAVEPLQGREFLEAQRVGAEVTTRIRIRYRDGIVAEMRVSWGDHTYDIEAVIHVEERQREIHLMCREVV